MNANVRGIGAGNRQIGLSAASLLPHSILPGYGLRYVKLLAWASGYNGLQLLPFWTYSENDLKGLKDEYQVLAYEGSWNGMYFDPRTTGSRIRRLDPGILLDTALFGTERHCGIFLILVSNCFRKRFASTLIRMVCVRFRRITT